MYGARAFQARSRSGLLFCVQFVKYAFNGNFYSFLLRGREVFERTRLFSSALGLFQRGARLLFRMNSTGFFAKCPLRTAGNGVRAFSPSTPTLDDVKDVSVCIFFETSRARHRHNVQTITVTHLRTDLGRMRRVTLEGRRES